MEVLTLLLLVGVCWVLGAIGFFVWNMRSNAQDHSDRLALLPLEENWTDARAAQPPRAPAPGDPT